MKDPKLYLIHISECIDRINEYTAEGEKAFFADKKGQDAVLRNLETMGEATLRLSPEFKAAHPEIDWSGIAGFRNILAHDYLSVVLDRVWEVVEEHLPILERVISEELKMNK